MDNLQGLAVRWIEIDTEVITHNIMQIKTQLANNVKLMAVVKGDAYGCGGVECARVALEAGCSMLGVTTLEEAVELRQHGISAPILVFSPLLSDEADWYVRFELTATIVHKESLAALAQAGENTTCKQSVHLKIETGMSRLGLTYQEISETLIMFKEFPNVALEGVYTHFAKVTDDKFVKKQADKLLQAVKMCEANGFTSLIVHACASGAFLKFPQYHFDMVRIGNLLYGQAPAEIVHTLNILDPWHCKARLLQKKKVQVGESIGYGRDFIAKHPMDIAVVPIGLADGFSLEPPRNPKNFIDLLKIIVKEILKFLGKPVHISGTVMYNGKNLPIIGRIGMQLTAVDVTDFPELVAQAEVEIGIRRTSASMRITRVFTKGNSVYSIRSIIGEQANEICIKRGVRA